MKKLVLIYGAVAGLVTIVSNTLSYELGIAHVWLGFLVMFIAFSTIFVAMKQYREDTLGGVIRFGTGFLVGLGVTIMASVVYMLGWELYLVLTDYAFIDSYANSIVDKQLAAGASEAEMVATIAEADAFRQQYTNPLFRLPMTFVEIFPVGLLISLISAAVLRDRKTSQGE